jgi:hypothetical protein
MKSTVPIDTDKPYSSIRLTVETGMFDTAEGAIRGCRPRIISGSILNKHLTGSAFFTAYVLQPTDCAIDLTAMVTDTQTLLPLRQLRPTKEKAAFLSK